MQPGRELAQRLLNARRAACDKGDKIAALHTRRVPFSEIADDATAYVKAHNWGWRHDTTRIAVLKETFGPMPAEIAPATFRKWLDEQPWKPASMNRMKSLLSTVYRLAMENGKAKSNPARALKWRREDNTKLRFLSPQEEIRLRAEIAKTYPWHLPEYLVALNTGMRPSEQYELEWSNVDFARKQISVLRSKSGKPRHIPMNSEVVSALRTVETRPVRGQRVFLSEDGQPLVGYKHWFGPALKAAKLCDTGVTWYTLRHGFASRLVMAGVNLRTVADLMGHATIQMTMRYAHLAPEYKQDAVERLISTQPDTGTNTDTTQVSEPVETQQVVALQ
jgi:integrase